MSDTIKAKLLKAKMAVSLSAIPIAAMAFATKSFAAVGVVLDTNAVLGAQTGLAEAAASLEGTINNQFFITLAVMFIGFAVVVGFLQTMVRGHRRI